eukprot:gene2559-67014_t
MIAGDTRWLPLNHLAGWTSHDAADVLPCACADPPCALDVPSSFINCSNGVVTFLVDLFFTSMSQSGSTTQSVTGSDPSDPRPHTSV